ncbi:hypothetical protein DDV93_10890 [Cereibacter johrii]|nr:hypothetical protein DDV93_10890 [Cereibacter johrii]
MTERHFRALVDRKGPGSLPAMAYPSVDPSMPALTMAGASDGRADLHDGADRSASVSMRSGAIETALRATSDGPCPRPWGGPHIFVSRGEGRLRFRP